MTVSIKCALLANAKTFASSIEGVSDRSLWLDILLRSYGQFILCGSPYSGIISIIIVGLTDWWLLFVSILACVAGNASALFFGAPTTAVRKGLYGWNPVLLACGMEVGNGPRWGALLPIIVASLLCSVIAVNMCKYLPARFCMVSGSLPCALAKIGWGCIYAETSASSSIAVEDPVLSVSLSGLFHATATGVSAITFSSAEYVWLVTLGLAMSEIRICGIVWTGALIGAVVDAYSGASAHHRNLGLSGLNSIFAFFTTFEVARPRFVMGSHAAALALSTCTSFGAAALSACGYLGVPFANIAAVSIANVFDLRDACKESRLNALRKAKEQ